MPELSGAAPVWAVCGLVSVTSRYGVVRRSVFDGSNGVAKRTGSPDPSRVSPELVWFCVAQLCTSVVMSQVCHWSVSVVACAPTAPLSMAGAVDQFTCGWPWIVGGCGICGTGGLGALLTTGKVFGSGAGEGGGGRVVPGALV